MFTGRKIAKRNNQLHVDIVCIRVKNKKKKRFVF